MKRIAKFSIVLVGLLVLLVMALQVSAQSTRTDFTTVEYDCLTGEGEVWQEGNVLHIRDRLHTNFDISDNPMWNGVNTTIADADINLKIGNAAIRGTLSFQPEGIDGTWEGTWVWMYNRGLGYGWGVAHGTGALEGKTSFMKVYDAPYDPVIEEMCAGTGSPDGVIYTEGYILDPGR